MNHKLLAGSFISELSEKCGGGIVEGTVFQLFVWLLELSSITFFYVITYFSKSITITEIVWKTGNEWENM